MFCYKCGKKLVEDAVFCSHCGEAVKSTDSVKDEADKAPEAAVQPTGNETQDVVCGEAVKAPEAPVGQDNNAHDDTAVKPARKVNKKALWIGISAAAVALIIAVAVQIITSLTSGFTFKNIPWGASKSEVINIYGEGDENGSGDHSIYYPYSETEIKFYGKKVAAHFYFEDDKLYSVAFIIVDSPDKSSDFETLKKKIQRDYLKTEDEEDDTHAIWDDDDYEISITYIEDSVLVRIRNNNYKNN